MKEEKFTIEIQGQVFAGTSMGSGDRLLLCFPGYGTGRNVFRRVLAPAEGWRILLMDLPGFGESAWREEGAKLEPETLPELLGEISGRFPHRFLDLLGYSLGARLCMALVAARPAAIRRVLLLAPDGIREHPLYRFCSTQPLGRWLFDQTLKRPGFFLFVTRTLHKLSLLSASKFRLIQSQMGHPDRRATLKKVWWGYADIRSDVRELAAHTVRHQISWHVIWGSQDTVLPPRYGKAWCEAIPGAKLELVSAGHLLLGEAEDKLKGIITPWMLHA